MPYKEFANGNPLPASDIDTYLMDQAVMTFANSTARSTAIPSPKEGMLTYLEDTNAYEGWTGSAWVNINDNSNAILKSVVTATGDLIVGNGNASVARLGIGTNGQVLSSNGTTATWTTPSGGGGMTLLASGTFSGNTNISSLNQSYKALRIVLTNVYRLTNQFNIGFANNGTLQNVNYWKDEYNGSSWSFQNSNDVSTLSIVEFNSVTPGNGQLIIDLWGYANTGPRQFMGYGSPQSGNSRYVELAGIIRSSSTSPIDQIQCFVTSGSYQVYGVS